MCTELPFKGVERCDGEPPSLCLLYPSINLQFHSRDNVTRAKLIDGVIKKKVHFITILNINY